MIKDFKLFTECEKGRGPAAAGELKARLVLATAKTKVGPSAPTFFYSVMNEYKTASIVTYVQ